MMRLSGFAFALLGLLAFAPAVRAQDFRQKLQEEARMQHERARELQHQSELDQNSANDFNQQAMRLDEHARRLEERGREFRMMADNPGTPPGSRDQLRKFAEESEHYAQDDRKSMEFRRRLGGDLANVSRAEADDSRRHEEHARRIEEMLGHWR